MHDFLAGLDADCDRYGGSVAEIVAVHGIGQYGSSAGRLRETWLPALREGLRRTGTVGPVDLARVDLDCVYYADLLRPGGKDAGMVPAYGLADIEPGFEQELLTLWWRAAAAYEPDRVPGPDSLTKIYSPQLVQRALASLSRSTFWSAVPRRVIIAALKDLRRYLYVPGIRESVRLTSPRHPSPRPADARASGRGGAKAFHVAPRTAPLRADAARCLG